MHIPDGAGQVYCVVRGRRVSLGLDLEFLMSSPIAHALGLDPSSSSSETQSPGTYLYIHADGYNQSLHSVDVEELGDSSDLYAEESEPIGLGIAILLSEGNEKNSEIFSRIADGSIIRGLVELEPGYLESKNAGTESQGIASKFFHLKACTVDLFENDRSGDWEYLYSKVDKIQYIGICDDYEFEEKDDDVFTAGYLPEEIHHFALADVSDGGSAEVQTFTSTDDILNAASERGLFAKPELLNQFKSLYQGKTFVVFGDFDWCEDTTSLIAALESLGLKPVAETEKPEVVFVGSIDSSVNGIPTRWEALVSSYPIQHGKFTEPVLKEVFKAAS